MPFKPIAILSLLVMVISGASWAIPTDAQEIELMNPSALKKDLKEPEDEAVENAWHLEFEPRC